MRKQQPSQRRARTISIGESKCSAKKLKKKEAKNGWKISGMQMQIWIAKMHCP
jgi:uncharacterized low-complexity protein